MRCKTLAVYVFALAAVGGAFGAAQASCAPWNKQFSGKYQRVCTDDQGRMYCEEADDANGKNAHKISCT